MARVVAIGMQKGGVGKTTTAINLGMGLVMADQQVLIVDADPQGNATSGLGVNSNHSGGLYELMFEDGSFQSVALSARDDGLHVLPPGDSLNGARSRLPKQNSTHQELKNKLSDVQEYYDWILIDCPPSLGPLTLNAFNAAGDLLVPLQSEYYALEGLTQLWSTYQSLKKQLNPSLSLLGILITMYDSRTNLAEEVRSDVRSHFEEQLFDTVIPRNIRVGEAPGHGRSVLEYAPSSKGSRAYLKFVREVLFRVRRETGSRSRRTAAGRT